MRPDELLKTALVDVLTQCLERGARLPLMVRMMSRNGSVIAIRCSPDREEPEVLAENNEDDSFDGPIGVLVLDQTGQALKFVIDQGQVTPEATTGYARPH